VKTHLLDDITAVWSVQKLPCIHNVRNRIITECGQGCRKSDLLGRETAPNLILVVLDERQQLGLTDSMLDNALEADISRLENACA